MPIRDQNPLYTYDLELLRLRLSLGAMVIGAVGLITCLYTQSYSWAALSAAVLALGVFSFD